MSPWYVDAMDEICDQRYLQRGSGPLIFEVHQETWRTLRNALLQKPWEECEPLRIMFRFCIGCNSFELWEYFTDGSGQMFGICWNCEYFVKRWKKAYIVGMLYNPIHAPERVIYESPLYHELAGDDVIDIDYEMPTKAKLKENYADGLIFPEESRTAGVGGPVHIHLPETYDARRLQQLRRSVDPT